MIKRKGFVRWNNPFPSNNINQVARRVHQIGNVYDTDLEDILQKQEELWAGVNEILARLNEVS